MTDALIVTQADHALLALLHPHAALQHELERAIVISSEALPPDVVTMNSRVVYSDETAGVQRVVSIVYPREADIDAGKISILVPVGTALLGLRVGQSIDWELPSGEKHRYRVIDVPYQPESALRAHRRQ